MEDDTTSPPNSSSTASPSSSAYSSPPPFSSLSFPSAPFPHRSKVTEPESTSLPALGPPPPVDEPSQLEPSSPIVAETKASLSRDKEGESSGKSPDDEPPPPYTEGSSPLHSFTYVMAAAGGASSIITQVQPAGGPPINTLGGTGSYLE